MEPSEFNDGNWYGGDTEIVGVFHMQAVSSAGPSGLTGDNESSL